MDLEPLIQEIVNSEDPVAEFSKVAADLDDRWKVTLAREVNKALFSQKLVESDLNDNIEFDVIEVPQMSKIASYNGTGAGFTKTASHNEELTKIAEAKKEQITASMFTFKEIKYNKPLKAKGGDFNFEKIAYEEEAKRMKDDRLMKKEAEEQKAKLFGFMVEQEKDALLHKIAEELTDVAELKYFTYKAVEAGLEKEAELVLEYAQPDTLYMQKVASQVSSLEKEKLINSAIKSIQELNKLASLPDDKKKEYYEGLEKNAAGFQIVKKFLLSVPGRATNLAGRFTSGLLKVPGTVTKGVVNTGKFAAKHPILTMSGIGAGAGFYMAGNHFDGTILGR